MSFYKHIYVYDLEVYRDVSFLCWIKLDGNSLTELTRGDFRLTPDKLRSFFQPIDSVAYIAYNSHAYDNAVINYVLSQAPTMGQIKAFSDSLIASKDKETHWSINLGDWERIYAYDLAKTLSLFSIMYGKSNQSEDIQKEKVKFVKSLKVLGSRIGKPPKNSTYGFNDNIIDVDDPNKTKYLACRGYCYHDCEITADIMRNQIDKLKAYEWLAQTYKLNHPYKGGTAIAKDVFSTYVSGDKQTEKPVWFGSYLLTTKHYREIAKRLITQAVASVTSDSSDDPFQLEEKLMNGLPVSIRLGGIHSINGRSVEHDVIDYDVASYYPSIMLRYGFKPACASDGFIPALQEITEERLKRKKAKDTVAANALKILINSVFGLMLQKRYDAKSISDKMMGYSVTLNGQLLLLDLCEKLEQAGANIIMLNTDGVSFTNPKTIDYKSVVTEWERRTLMEGEYSNYSTMYISSISNYIAI